MILSVRGRPRFARRAPSILLARGIVTTTKRRQPSDYEDSVWLPQGQSRHFAETPQTFCMEFSLYSLRPGQGFQQSVDFRIGSDRDAETVPVLAVVHIPDENVPSL